MSADKKCVLAVDIGGSKFITGFLGADGEILYSLRQEWRGLDRDSVIDRLTEAVRDTLASHPEFSPAAVGMTIPGIADPAAGIWVSSPLGEINDFAVCDHIGRVTGLPVYIENDANACALAELYFGTGKGCRNFLYMTVSSGVGGALILGGRLYSGASGGAGEIGVTVAVENSSRRNSHGQRGLLELYASTSGLRQNYLECGGRPEINGAPPDGRSIAELARGGDPAAERAFCLEGHYLGRAIAAANNLLDLERVVIGGGLSLAFDLYRDELLRVLREEDHQNTPGFAVLPTMLGYEGAFVGAGTVALLGCKMLQGG